MTTPIDMYSSKLEAFDVVVNCDAPCEQRFLVSSGALVRENMRDLCSQSTATGPKQILL